MMNMFIHTINTLLITKLGTQHRNQEGEDFRCSQWSIGKLREYIHKAGVVGFSKHFWKDCEIVLDSHFLKNPLVVSRCSERSK